MQAHSLPPESINRDASDIQRVKPTRGQRACSLLSTTAATLIALLGFEALGTEALAPAHDSSNILTPTPNESLIAMTRNVEASLHDVALQLDPEVEDCLKKQTPSWSAQSSSSMSAAASSTSQPVGYSTWVDSLTFRYLGQEFKDDGFHEDMKTEMKMILDEKAKLLGKGQKHTTNFVGIRVGVIYDTEGKSPSASAAAAASSSSTTTSSSSSTAAAPSSLRRSPRRLPSPTATSSSSTAAAASPLRRSPRDHSATQSDPLIGSKRGRMNGSGADPTAKKVQRRYVHQPLTGFLCDTCFNSGEKNKPFAGLLSLGWGNVHVTKQNLARFLSAHHKRKMTVQDVEKSPMGFAHSETAALGAVDKDADECDPNGPKMNSKNNCGLYQAAINDGWVDRLCDIVAFTLQLTSIPNSVCKNCDRMIRNAQFVHKYAKALDEYCKRVRGHKLPVRPKVITTTSCASTFSTHNHISCAGLHYQNVVDAIMAEPGSVVLHMVPNNDHEIPEKCRKVKLKAPCVFGTNPTATSSASGRKKK